jgi:hypothetical protein
VTQGVGPELKSQYCKRKKKFYLNNKMTISLIVVAILVHIITFYDAPRRQNHPTMHFYTSNLERKRKKKNSY